MKLNANHPQGLNAITACGPGFVVINGQTHQRSLVVGLDRLPEDWPVATIDDLSHELLARLERGSDVILLGTGTRQRFPPPALLRPLLEKGIGVEVMDTAAACRTYNLLLSEGRAVVAALIIE